jgi:NitT/TauT family transport system permease protein
MSYREKTEERNVSGIPGIPGETMRTLSLYEKLYNIAAVRKLFLLIVLALAWQFYSAHIDNPLMFPSLTRTMAGLADVVWSGELPLRALASLRVILVAYAGGVTLAGLLTVFAITTRPGTDLLEILTAMFNPLPAIALLPLALLWFGLGYPSIIFVIVHAVSWPVALNIYTGFMGVSQTLRMVGRNYGLSGLAFVFGILVPAAFPHILTGLKIGWAFSWRTLIAAELVFGVSSGKGGLGWFLYEKKNQLDIDLVFAGLLTVIIIGVLVEGVVFKFIEERTVVRWGMKS